MLLALDLAATIAVILASLWTEPFLVGKGRRDLIVQMAFKIVVAGYLMARIYFEYDLVALTHGRHAEAGLLIFVVGFFISTIFMILGAAERSGKVLRRRINRLVLHSGRWLQQMLGVPRGR
jgi:hypothetical protein